MVGTAETRLVVLRGNSASGKSTVAAGIRERFGRGLALVGQDNLRRVVLRERDRPDGANIGLIDTVARYALDSGYQVVLEGILYVAHYGRMLQQLHADHRGHTLLPGGVETVLGADSALVETVDRIMLDSGLAGLPALDN
jgi:chloramphenicol 3-O-phosphotransferase